jgi:hypothetical protein
MTEDEWRGGLAEHYDYMLAKPPSDPEMRESASIWLFEESGAFSFPRIGIEAHGKVWDTHRYDCNFAFRDGRVLRRSKVGQSRRAMGADGKPSVLGVDGLVFRVVEPFKRWVVSFDGSAVDSTAEAWIREEVDTSREVPVKFETELTMVTPAWTQDFTPEKLARMSEAERTDAGLMGFGYRMEHLFRATGQLEIDGTTRDFNAVGSRIHRQSVRPMGAFRGHCWQSAVFPDGRAFGYIAYPPASGEENTYNDGYIYQDGKMHVARARNIPFLRRLMLRGDDVSVQLESELGVTRIGGISEPSVIRVGNPDTMGLTLQQGGVRYTWDDQAAYGMIERSSPVESTEVAL